MSLCRFNFLPLSQPFLQYRQHAHPLQIHQLSLMFNGCSPNHLSQKLSGSFTSGTLIVGILTLGTLMVGVTAYAVTAIHKAIAITRSSAKSFLIVVSSLFISNSIPIVLLGVHKTVCCVRSCPMESTTFHITIIRYTRTRCIIFHIRIVT